MSLDAVELSSGIARGSALTGELDAHRMLKLIYMHVFTGLFFAKLSNP